MQVYLVGGAVRDYVLAREVNAHDYVVVGATPEQMLELGFSPFPAFRLKLKSQFFSSLPCLLQIL